MQTTRPSRFGARRIRRAGALLAVMTAAALSACAVGADLESSATRTDGGPSPDAGGEGGNRADGGGAGSSGGSGAAADADASTGEPDAGSGGAGAGGAAGSYDAGPDGDAGAGGEGGADSGAGGSSGGGEDAGTDAPASACDGALAGVAFDFESGAAGFTHRILDGVSSGGWPYDEWAVGSTSLPPGGCHGGTSCWGTALNENYAQCQRAALESPELDLSECAATPIKLVFWHYYDFWQGSYGGQSYADGGAIEFSDDGGSTWTAPLPPVGDGTIAINPDMGPFYVCTKSSSFYVNGKNGFTGANGAWERVELPIPTAFRTSRFRVRFAWSSGVSSSTTSADTSRQATAPGWYIDDLSIAP